MFTLDYNNIRYVDARIPVSFINITDNNYYRVKGLVKDNFYVKDFRRMLRMGDHGVYTCVNDKIVGYGWVKIKGSRDYFFRINNAYLCRFYVDPSCRGLNLYPATILYLIKHLKGITKYYIACDVDNYASIKGIRKIGFKLLCDLSFVRILKITINKKQLN